MTAQSLASQDVAAAAKLVAAVSADDQPGWVAVINEARRAGRLTELCLAAAAQCVSIAGEYYDVDVQTFLDRRAFEALTLRDGPPQG